MFWRQRIPALFVKTNRNYQRSNNGVRLIYPRTAFPVCPTNKFWAFDSSSTMTESANPDTPSPHTPANPRDSSQGTSRIVAESWCHAIMEGITVLLRTILLNHLQHLFSSGDGNSFFPVILGCALLIKCRPAFVQSVGGDRGHANANRRNINRKGVVNLVKIVCLPRRRPGSSPGQLGSILRSVHHSGWAGIAIWGCSQQAEGKVLCLGRQITMLGGTVLSCESKDLDLLQRVPQPTEPSRNFCWRKNKGDAVSSSNDWPTGACEQLIKRNWVMEWKSVKLITYYLGIYYLVCTNMFSFHWSWDSIKNAESAKWGHFVDVLWTQIRSYFEHQDEHAVENTRSTIETLQPDQILFAIMK